MKTWDEICEAVNVTYEQTQQVDETAKIVGVSRWEVLEALGSATSGHASLRMNKILVWEKCCEKCCSYYNSGFLRNGLASDK